jgi:integrator complex subunit 11
VVVTIGGKRVMFDCGMHMAYQDHRRYPDFSRVLDATGAPDFTAAISCVVITHLCVHGKARPFCS